MGEKEIFLLFLLSFCLVTFGLQPKSTDTSHQIAATDTFNVSYHQ